MNDKKKVHDITSVPENSEKKESRWKNVKFDKKKIMQISAIALAAVGGALLVNDYKNLRADRKNSIELEPVEVEVVETDEAV